jgi:hypothetical protein
MFSNMNIMNSVFSHGLPICSIVNFKVHICMNPNFMVHTRIDRICYVTEHDLSSRFFSKNFAHEYSSINYCNSYTLLSELFKMS